MIQLQMVAAEIDRELSSLSARQANAVTRASIILAAAGVTAFAVVENPLAWSLVPAIFSLASAALCLAAIRYWKSDAGQIERKHVKPYLGAAPYTLLWRQVMDKFKELDAARADLTKKARLLRWGVVFLVLAWVAAVIVRFVVVPIATGIGY